MRLSIASADTVYINQSTNNGTGILSPAANSTFNGDVFIFGDGGLANITSAGNTMPAAAVQLEDGGSNSNPSNYFGANTVHLDGGSLTYHANGGGTSTSVNNVVVDTSGYFVSQPQGGHGTIAIGNLTTNATSTVTFESAWDYLGTGSGTSDIGYVTIGNVNGVSSGSPGFLTNRIIGGWATTVSYKNGADGEARFATYGANGVTAVTPDGSTINGAAATANIFETSAQTVSANTTINSLATGGSGGGADITIANGVTLTLQSGGFIENDDHWVFGGNITAGAGSRQGSSGNYNLFITTVNTGGNEQFRTTTVVDNPDGTPVTIVKGGIGYFQIDQTTKNTGGVVVNNGTLGADVTNNQTGTFADGTHLTINGGGVLLANATDALGWGGGNHGVSTITLNEGGILTTAPGSRLSMDQQLTSVGGTIAAGGPTYGDGNASYSFRDGNGGRFNFTSAVDGTPSTISAINTGLNGNTTFNVTAGGGPVDLNISGTLIDNFGTGALIKSGNGVLVLGNANTYTGGTTITGGKVVLGNSAAFGTGLLRNENGAIIDLAGFSPTIPGISDGQGLGGTNASTIISSSGAPTLTIKDNNLGYGGSISGPIAVVVNTGPGGYQVFSGSNSYTGGTTINGQLEAWSANALGNGTVGVSAGGTLALKGNSDGIVYAANPLTLANTASVILNTDATLRSTTYSGGVTLAGGTASLQIGGGSGNPGSITLSGVVSGAGGLSISGANLTTIFSNANTYQGGTTLNSGTLVMANSNALQNTTLTDNGAVVFDQAEASSSFNVGGLAGAGNIPLQNNASAPAAVALTFGSNNASTAYSGALSGPGSVTKVGSGTASFSGPSTFTGSTTVSAGSLLLSGTGAINGSSGISVNGATARFVQASSTAVSPTVSVTLGALDGTGTINTATVADNLSNVVTAGNGGAGTLSFNSLTFAGAATFNLSNVAQVTAATLTTANTGAGEIVVNATNTNGFWSNGTVYDLINYTTLNGQFADFTRGSVPGLSSRQSATLVNLNNNEIALSIAGDSPVWTGALSNEWSTATLADPKNWKLITRGTTTDYVEGDVVLFDDTANKFTVDISAADVSPTAVQFNNSSKNYTLISSKGHGIVGAATLVKNGTGTVTIETTNSFTGGTTINAGTLALGDGTAGHDGALSGTSIINNATLAYNLFGNQTFGGTIGSTGTGAVTVAIANGSTLALNGNISGANSISLTGPGNLVLAGSNSCTGGTALTGGTLQFSSDVNLGAAASAVSINAATLDLLAGNTVSTPRAISIAGSATLQVDAGSTLTPATAITETSAGSSLIKAGPGNLVVGVHEAYTGDTLVNGGTLQINPGGLVNGTAGNVFVNNAATLALNVQDIWGNATTAPNVVINVNAGGTVTSNGFFNELNNLHLNGGSVVANGGNSATYGAYGIEGTVVVAGSAASSISTTGAGAFNFIDLGQQNANTTTTFQVAQTGASGPDLSISLPIANNGNAVSALNKTGAGTLLLAPGNPAAVNLPVDNTFSGGTTITAGTVVAGARGLGSGPLNVLANGTLSVSRAGASAQTGVGLAGQYFNIAPGNDGGNPGSNPSLVDLTTLLGHFGTHSPNVAVNTPSLNLGQSGNPNTLTMPAPYNGGNSNNFESLYSGMINIAQGGTYTFNTSSDDGSVLFIDGQLVVNNNFYQGVVTRSGNVTLSQGEHDITVAFYQGGGGYGLFAQYKGQDTGGNFVDLASTSAPITPDLLVNSLTGSGSISLLTGNLIFGQDNSSNTFSGPISGIGGITKWGTGSQLLSGSNSYTGGTAVAGGTLQLGGSNAIGVNNKLLIGSSATLDLNSQSVAVDSLLGNNGALVTNSAISSNSIFTVGAAGGSGAFGGVIQDGGGTVSFIKAGAGTQTLSGNNTFSGNTVVNGGTLALATAGNNNIPLSRVIVLNGGGTLDVHSVAGAGGFVLNGTNSRPTSQILAGTGTVTGGVTVASGATISAGTSTVLGTGSDAVGTLNTGAQTWQANGNYAVKLVNAGASTTPGADNDELNLTGLLSVNSGGASASFNILPLGTFANLTFGQTYTWTIGATSVPAQINGVSGSAVENVNLLKSSSGSPVFALDTTNFGASLTGGGVSSADSSNFSLDLVAAAGGDNVVLSYTATPEPGTALLVLAGFGPLLMARRRRRSASGTC